MRYRIGLFYLMWGMMASPLYGQTLQTPLPVSETYPGWESPVNVPTQALFESPYVPRDEDALKFWSRGGYLLGRVRESPLPFPLVTTGSAKDNKPGAIGQSGTQVQVGNSGIGFRVFSGVSVALGGWIDSERTLGVEVSGFVLERRLNRNDTPSDNTGNPLLALPFFNTATGSRGESAIIIANPGKSTGDILLTSSLQLWGLEANGLYCLWRQPGLEFSMIAGFRYVDLQEGLDLHTQSATLVKSPASSVVTTLDDLFHTRNQFYGGQVGSCVHWQRDVLTIDITGKIALGDTHQVEEIQGESSKVGSKSFPSRTFPGGIFAQPSNIGRLSANEFTVIPSLDVILGYQLTRRCRALVGYEFMYWNQVIRPGDQIDRNININQSMVLGSTRGVTTGLSQPAALFNRTDFWAQGVNFALEFRY